MDKYDVLRQAIRFLKGGGIKEAFVLIKVYRDKSYGFEIISDIDGCKSIHTEYYIAELWKYSNGICEKCKY